MTDVHVVNKKKQRKYINSYNRKEKMIDIVNQKKQRKYIYSYNTEEKKMIDVHAVNKKNKESIQILTIEKKK